MLPSLQVHEKDVQKFAPLTTSITPEQLAIFFYHNAQPRYIYPPLKCSFHTGLCKLISSAFYLTRLCNKIFDSSTIKYHKLAWTFFFLFCPCFVFWGFFFAVFFYLFCFLRGLLVMIILFLNHYVSFHCFILCVPYSYWPVELVLLPTKLANSDWKQGRAQNSKVIFYMYWRHN